MNLLKALFGRRPHHDEAVHARLFRYTGDTRFSAAGAQPALIRYWLTQQ